MPSEGEDVRVIHAAIQATEQKIAKIILLGSRSTIENIASNHGLQIPSEIEIINYQLVAHKYIDTLVKVRSHKGMTRAVAVELVNDPIMVATLMLYMGEADGIVSGACNTTAHTIRPALQIIKTSPNYSLISSLFFMCLSDRVLLFADCAVNPNPDSHQLATIAIQSANSAKMFGIEPKVAMISYSTGSSGSGQDVEKVIKATDIIKKQEPDLLVEGPIQYDAAVNETVAKKKAPNSKVAGHANVIVFPDLNTGNTTYKAVQRSADILCLGPMLQGLKKPVNDLSRGASYQDIFYTIALTAIQANES